MAFARKPHAAPPVAFDGSAGVYLFCGDESFLRRTHLHTLVSKTLGTKDDPDADASMAISQFAGGEVSLAAVLDELRTLPFLAERRVVIVQDADALIGPHRDALEKYAEKPCPTGVLVLLADDERSNTRLYKAIAARGGLVLCERLAQSDLARWIRERAKDTYQKTVDYETASLLADLIGDDLDKLDSELAKLATYLGAERKTITPEDVDELVANQRMHEAFELTAAIAGKDATAALTRWNDMLSKDPNSSYSSVGLIAWQIRQMLRARALRAQGLSRDEVLSRLRMPFSVRERFAEQVNKFPERRLRMLLAG
ncbi:MAG: DNA polymerase III subunit delta, partial [Phycisphaerae bacterium]|nr:DNA polymerase III subunit delta [Phycisphaerae bacterium]